MNKLLYAFVGLVVLAVAAVLIGPSFIDWNVYKDRIVAALRDATGRELTIGGGIQFAILPSPAFSAGQVELANLPGGSAEPMLALEEMRLRVAFWPLLQGRVRVESIALVAPRLLLEILPDGRWNWQQGAGETAGGAEAGVESEAESGGLPAAIAVESFTVKSGRITFHDRRDGRLEVLDGLNGEVIAESLAGPFTVKGEGRLHEVAATFDLAAGQFHAAGATPFRAVVGLPLAGAKLELGGSFSRHPDSFGYRAMVKAAGGDLAAAAGALGWPSGRAGLPAAGFSLTANVEGDLGRLAVADLELLLDEARLTGEASWHREPDPKFQVSLRGARIDLDRLAGEGPAPTAGGPDEGAKGDQSPALAPDWWRGLVLPAGVDGEFSLAVDGLVLRGRTLRQVRFDAALDKGLLIVEQATVELPGSARVWANGILADRGEGPRFAGTVEAESADLRGLVGWLGLAVDDLPPDRLRRLSLKANLAIDAQEVRLDKAELQVDLAKINGGVVAALRQRLGLGIGLVVDRLNLDAYLSAAPSGDAAAGAGDAGDRLAVAALFSAWPDWIDRVDANLDLRVGSLLYRGQSLDNLRLEGTLREGALSLREASVGDLAGAQAGFSGVLSGLSLAPRVDGTLDLRARDGVRLARALGLEGDALPPLGGMTLTAALRGAPDDLTFDGQLAALDATLEVSGTARLNAAPAHYAVAVALRHPELAALLRALGREVSRDSDLGRLDLSARIAGSPQALRVDDLALATGRLELSGSLAAELSGERPSITAVLAGGELHWVALKHLAAGLSAASPTADRPVARAADGEVPLDLSYLQGLDAELAVTLRALVTDDLRIEDLALQAVLGDGLLSVERLVGMLDRGTLQLSGRLAAAPPNAASATVALKGVPADGLLAHWLPVSIAGGDLELEATLATQGPSQAQMAANLAGEGRLAGRLTLAVPAPADKDLPVAGLAESARLIGEAFGAAPAQVAGRFTLRDGLLATADTRLEGQGAWAAVRASADLEAEALDSTTEIYRAAAPDAPYLTVRLTGDLNEPDIALSGEPFRRESEPAESDEPSAAGSPPLDQAIDDLLKSLGN